MRTDLTPKTFSNIYSKKNLKDSSLYHYKDKSVTLNAKMRIS